MIKQRVAKFIQENNLFSPEDKILVALSGGADSVALLYLLLELGYTCEAAHCNFHLRAEESDRDEAFVQELCRQQNIHLHSIHFDTIEYAKDHKLSIEMAARELRYQWFEKLRQEFGFSTISVAHHKDDNVETILVNLIRGTGLNGLTGIQPANGNIVRPLLCLTREEIIEYLSEKNQSFVTDSTNLQDQYTRNKIRLKLLPLMQEINPSVKESISNTIGHLNDVYKLYKHTIEESIQRIRTNKGILIDDLLHESSPKVILFEMLHPLGFNSSQIEDIYESLKGQPGKQFISKKGWIVLKDRKILYINKVEKEGNDLPPFSLKIEEEEYFSDFIIPRDKNIACLDADKITQPFHLRKWQRGDTFVPFGMKGKKNVSDYLTDRKMSLIQKDNQWVLCSGDKIAWLINERIDNRFRIDDKTKKIIVIRIIPTQNKNN